MKIFCVRIGNKYGPEYEDYIESKLQGHNVIWIRKPYRPEIPLQWNKIQVFGMDIDEPVILMDIDKLLINDYHEIINYPCTKGQFVTTPYWWKSPDIENPYKSSGGFYKFWPSTTRHIYEKYMSDIPYYTNYYIKNRMTTGPVNGEFMFVQDSLYGMDMQIMPDSWFTRWVSNTNYKANTQVLENRYCEVTGNEYLFDGTNFHPDVKMVHFTHSLNKPHEWKNYEYYKKL